MHEHTAMLVQHQNEGVLVTDDDEPERAWQDFDAAMKELQLDGWLVAQSPAAIQASMAGLGRYELWGHRLRRSVH